jgi:hypothetical protein
MHNHSADLDQIQEFLCKNWTDNASLFLFNLAF